MAAVPGMNLIVARHSEPAGSCHARPRHRRMPTVTEVPRPLEPITRDPFIDGLNNPASKHRRSTGPNRHVRRSLTSLAAVTQPYRPINPTPKGEDHMHATRMPKLNLRRSLVLGATALAIGAAATGVVAENASAASTTLGPGQSANFPTYFWGRTTICIDNPTDRDGHATFSAWGSQPVDRWVPAKANNICETRGWVGFNVNVKNSSGLATFWVRNVGGPG
jgi:hypothetical protein